MMILMREFSYEMHLIRAAVLLHAFISAVIVVGPSVYLFECMREAHMCVRQQHKTFRFGTLLCYCHFESFGSTPEYFRLCSHPAALMYLYKFVLIII